MKKALFLSNEQTLMTQRLTLFFNWTLSSDPHLSQRQDMAAEMGKNQQLVPSHIDTWSRNRLYRRWDECSDSDRTNIYWLLWRRRSEHKMPSNQKKRHLRQYLPLNNVGGKSAPIWHKTQKNVHVAIATGWLMSLSVAVTTNTNFLSVMCSQHMSDIL